MGRSGGTVASWRLLRTERMSVAVAAVLLVAVVAADLVTGEETPWRPAA